MLSALRRAAGAPVSYAELRKAGIELPASVVSELELAGIPVERCLGEGGRGMGVRLDPARDPSVRAELANADETSGALTREKPFGVKPPRRALGLTALVAGIAVAFAAVALLTSGGARRTAMPVTKRPDSRSAVAATSRAPLSRAPRSTPAQTPVSVSPALATELEAQGHNLLEAGQYADAVPVLRRAVLATGETVAACLEPASLTCLTYAYALYDLGRAVRLSGQPQAAVPILERRLQIDNQRSTVVGQLQLARQGVS